jgi:hypothetical protein
MTPELLAIRQRLRDDFPYYAENALVIRTKAGEIAPLKLKPAQVILNEATEKQIAANLPCPRHRTEGAPAGALYGHWGLDLLVGHAAQRAAGHRRHTRC